MTQKIRFSTYELLLGCEKKLMTGVFEMSIPLFFCFWLRGWHYVQVFAYLQVELKKNSSKHIGAATYVKLINGISLCVKMLFRHGCKN